MKNSDTNVEMPPFRNQPKEGMWKGGKKEARKGTERERYELENPAQEAESRRKSWVKVSKEP